ncbi:hypothetical protein L7F22_047065 [Adiantum nelumboides]|nr:hypothetical protein [Adiantum nelumboides]
MREGKVEDVKKNRLMQLFHQLLSERDSSSRRVGMMWLERAIAERMQPIMNEAAKAKEASFIEWQKDIHNVEYAAVHRLAKQDYVDKMLGVGNLWRELCHIFVASPKQHRNFATLAARHLMDGFSMEILDGDSGMFCREWVDTILSELHTLTTQALNKQRPARVFVLSVVGLQSSGKSTLLNLMFGTQLHTSAGRCTRGVHFQLVKAERDEYDYVLLLDTEGIRSPEFYGLYGSHIRDNRLGTFALLPVDASVLLVPNEDDTGLKEVLSMALLAFKGSAIAESYGGRVRSKMVFVYRSVDINDKKKLKDNKEKLQLDLMTAAGLVAATEDDAELDRDEGVWLAGGSCNW